MITTKLKRISATDWGNQFSACPGAVSVNPQVWTEKDGNIYIHPAYGINATATSIAAFIGSTETAISLIDTTNFKNAGRVRIDSEEIDYATKDATTLYGCIRGVAGTLPASHDSGLPVATQLDLFIVYRQGPKEMATVTDTPEIPSCYHQYLELYVMYLAYLQSGEREKAAAMMKQWKEAVSLAQFSASREHLSQMGLQDMNTQLANSLYGPR